MGVGDIGDGRRCGSRGPSTNTSRTRAHVAFPRTVGMEMGVKNQGINERDEKWIDDQADFRAESEYHSKRPTHRHAQTAWALQGPQKYHGCIVLKLKITGKLLRKAQHFST